MSASLRTETMSDAGAARYPHALSPVRIGPHLLRNRIFVPAHTTNYGDDNLPSDRHLAYHQARAAGGVAMIVFEGIRVHRSSLGRRQGVNGYEPEAIERFARIAAAVRAEGARLFGQIIHLGRHIDGNYARMASWSASPIPWSPTAPPPHPMTPDEIAEVVEAHALVARNLVAAGLDGIELQMGHGHLLQQFMSPAANQRDDIFGGAEENRLRFACDTLKAVRAAVPADVALGVRISADEFLPGGLGVDAMVRIAPQIAATAPIDFVNVSHSAYHGSYTIATQMADMAFSRETFHPLPRRMSEALRAAGHDVPVFAVCKFRSVAEADAMLADGQVAMVGMARAHIADPALVRKAAAGHEADTRTCIGCNQGCAGFLALNLPITCTVNPRAGREAEWPEPHLAPAATPRHVVVVGGGPAGLEAAATAAARGHRVTLFEAASELGGALRWTLQMPLRVDFGLLLARQIRAVEQGGVRLRLGAKADAATILAEAPDAVIMATGAAAGAIAFPGGGRGLTFAEALADPDALGAEVAVLDTVGSWAMAGVLEYLADLGKRVTVFAPGGVPGWNVNIYSGFAWRKRLRDKRVAIEGHRTIHSFRDGQCEILDVATGESCGTRAFDSVIAPDHGRPNLPFGRADLLDPARNAPLAFVAIGDCLSPRTALEAVFEGQEIARGLG
jgi:2,4-dienoyl-CoA reductase-like NADH-dependent reductase (Old Yellow Enzyme family)